MHNLQYDSSSGMLVVKPTAQEMELKVLKLKLSVVQEALQVLAEDHPVLLKILDKLKEI